MNLISLYLSSHPWRWHVPARTGICVLFIFRSHSLSVSLMVCVSLSARLHRFLCLFTLVPGPFRRVDGRSRVPAYWVDVEGRRNVISQQQNRVRFRSTKIDRTKYIGFGFFEFLLNWVYVGSFGDCYLRDFEPRGIGREVELERRWPRPVQGRLLFST